MRREISGDLRSSSLAGPYRRLCTGDTSENRIRETGENKFVVLPGYPTGRLRTLLTMESL